jgi:hypothetical protein
MTTIRLLARAYRTLWPRAAAVMIAGTVALLTAASAVEAQQSYQTPDEAAAALVSAVRADDQNAELAVLGPDSDDIISSGDKVSDDAIRERFLESYDAKHQITTNGDSKAILVIGDNDYPFPIPLTRKAGKWSFDTEEGRREILYRRIGRNELDAIQVCLAYVDAQDEYAEKDRTGAGAGVYAEHFISNPGKKDGLYWQIAQGDEESPLGELFAKASEEGYKADEGRSPYHGYYYKIITKQDRTRKAAQPTMSWWQDDRRFCPGRYPAEYRNSGVVTFIVNHTGAVFQKDLGPDTAKLAEKISSFDPDSTWKKVGVTGPAK